MPSHFLHDPHDASGEYLYLKPVNAPTQLKSNHYRDSFNQIHSKCMYRGNVMRKELNFNERSHKANYTAS